MNSDTLQDYLLSNDNLFMFVFMSQFEQYLNNNSNEIDLNFHFDEANVDAEFKEFVKNTIMSEFNKINLEQEKIIITIDNITKEIPLKTFQYYQVINVYLPTELDDEIKNTFRTDGVVFTDPDIVLEIKNDTSIFYRSIELKSTKDNNIPGSSVQQIKPFEWVLFFKNTAATKDFTTGMYIHSITETMQFPDRSPRPQVSFSNLKNWNNSYRTIKDSSISFSVNEENLETKLELITDWQTVLAHRWNDLLFSYKSKKRIPWFENNLRKFIIIFLENYESLSTEEKEEFKTKNKSLIR